MKSKIQKVTKIVFILYMLALFLFVIVKFHGSFDDLSITRELILWNREQGFWNYNITPFKTISPYFEHFTDSYAHLNIVGNIIPFIPFGFMVPIAFLKKKRFLKTMLLSLLCILLFETFQFVSMLGFFDVDDIILNMMGCILGYVIYLPVNIIIAKITD